MFSLHIAMHLENTKATYKRRTKAIHQRANNNRNILYMPGLLDNLVFVFKAEVKAQYHI